MVSMRSHKNGFSIIEILLLLVAIFVIVLAGVLIYTNKLHSKSSNEYSQPTTTSANTNLIPPSIPNNHAYLGAFINPEHIGLGENGEPGSNVIQQLPAFNQLIGEHLAIIHFYTPFKTPLPTSTLNAISANNSIPLISWGCTNVKNIADGQYDNTINSFANGLKNFGKPVFLRWYWEMNQQNKTGGSPAGSNCDGFNNGPGYIAAWQHIFKIFQEDKATNVAFVWCPGYTGGNFDAYYPGDSYVNWIGLDRYERTKNGQPLLSFSDMFGSYYSQWNSHNKPIMIAETAAMGGAYQLQYLNEIQSQAPNYPSIKAYVYFDATGPAGDWSLKDQGVQAFQSLAKASYFSKSLTKSPN